MEKNRNIVMLPAKDTSTLAIICNELCHVSDEEQNPYEVTEFEREYLDEDNHTLPQHLYILSEEGCIWGDYVCDTASNKHYKLERGTEYSATPSLKKVIATTDTSLDLPLVGEDFLKKYIIRKMTQCIVEYDVDCIQCDHCETSHHNKDCPLCGGDGLEKPKLNVDGSVVIHLRRLYNREEVIALCEDARDRGERHGEILWEEWIDKKL